MGVVSQRGASTTHDLTSEIFRFLTPASPLAVWQELTRIGEPCAHLPGLTVETDWAPGSALTVAVPSAPAEMAITGQILHAEPPWVLTYSLGDDGSGSLPVYLTWQLEPTAVGTIVRLYVDETGPSVSPGLELTWLPVVEALRLAVRSGSAGD
jgi:hypothetical protein